MCLTTCICFSIPFGKKAGSDCHPRPHILVQTRALNPSHLLGSPGELWKVPAMSSAGPDHSWTGPWVLVSLAPGQVPLRRKSFSLSIPMYRALLQITYVHSGLLPPRANLFIKLLCYRKSTATLK